MKLDEFLKELNLSPKETQVYSVCLKLGEVNIVPIQKELSLPRTTIFRILEKLRDKGIIEIIQTPARRLYSPYPPRKVLTLLEKKEQDLKEKTVNLKGFLPELNRTYNFSPFQPRIRFFRGLEIKAIYEEILESPIKEFYYIGEVNHLTEILDYNFFRSFVRRKVAKGIWTKSLRVKTKEDSFFDPKSDLRKVKYLPKDFQSPVHIYIYANNVAVLTSAQENFAVVTTSEEYATTMKSWFNTLWRISAP